MIISLVAGEASGDQLGAALIRAIVKEQPDARFVGIGGPLMKAAGMETWWDSAELSVMGLFEVIKHIPRLLGLRRQLVARLLELEPDVFIGIDAPDFNLGVEKRLKRRAIPVIHYVSPTVWAWRSGRVRSIARSTDRVMCLFPFESAFYAQHDVPATYTGHPLADQITPGVEKSLARAKLDISGTSRCVALLPGSRLSEVGKLTTPMLDAAAMLTSRYPGIRFVVPAASEQIRQFLGMQLKKYASLECRVFSSNAKQVIAASDLVVCASGTATLEVMLINRPMVVCYRLAGTTYTLAKWLRLVKSRFFALPNILAAEPLVPELLQHEVTGERIAQEVSKWLEEAELRADLEERFAQLHEQLRVDAASTAARTVLDHLAIK